MNKYYWLLGIGLLLYSLTAYADTTAATTAPLSSFDAPARISSFVVWSFTYTAMPTNLFDETRIYFGPSGANLVSDQYLIGTLTNSRVFIENPLRGKGLVNFFTWDTHPGEVDGLVLNATYMGLQPGEYSLLAVATSNKSIKDSVEARIMVIDPVAKSEVDQANQQLSQAASDLEALKESKDELGKKFSDMLNATQQAYQQFDTQLNSLNDSITKLQSRTDALDEKTKTALTEMQTTVVGTQADLKTLMDENDKKKKEAAQAGFLNLGNLSQFGPQALVGVVIAAILAGGYVFMKSRKSEDGGLSDSEFESGLGLGGGLSGWGKASSPRASASAGVQASAAGAKWAVPGASRGPSARASDSGSSRKIAIGSLVRK